MVTYALLSNTLLLTVLVAILGNTFATINADAAAESMFRKAVSTIEGVKADAVFSYQLPFNLVAVVFMWPMSYILNPRWYVLELIRIKKLIGQVSQAEWLASGHAFTLRYPELTNAPVWLIRASNLPVLLAISLYERQSYRETSLVEQMGDWAERYVGNLPRRITAAGRSTLLECQLCLIRISRI